MKCLITGNLGFIGSNLQKALKCKTYGYDLKYSEKNLDELEDCPKVGGIFHLGMGSSSPMYEDPQVVKDAIQTTTEVIELANLYNCPVVYASTSSIYNGNSLPWCEITPIHPTDLYTHTRYLIEDMFQTYIKRSIGLRLFSVFGTGDEKKGRFANNITQFALNILQNKRPIVYGDGTQSRDFIHVSHVVDEMIDSLGKSGIRNVGSGERLSFNTIIKMINHFYGKDIRPKYTKNPIKNYVTHTQSSTKRNYNFIQSLSDHLSYLYELEGNTH